MNCTEAPAAPKDRRINASNILFNYSTYSIILPAKHSGSLWALSWHLTSAFATEASLIQKIKWLGGLFNKSGLFNRRLPF